MTARRYGIWDVFTSVPFSGNPLAVVEDCDGLDTDAMHRIAREFNLSETVFLLPPETAAAGTRVRIFTPKHELPFAGHPTVGAAIALAGGQPREMVLEEGIGPIPCSVALRDGVPFATLTNTAPLSLGAEIARNAAATCLSLPVASVSTATHAPVIAAKGVPFAMIELVDPGDLDRAAADATAMADLERSLNPPVEALGDVPWVRRGPDALEMRMFEPLGGIPEDPATGSAAAALAALLCHVTGAPQDLTIAQGVAMGRPSTIAVTARQPAPSSSEVTVTGSAVQVMRGEILP